MISEHISYKEGTNSITAIRRGIDNTPNDEQLDNMELIAEKVFEPLRKWAVSYTHLTLPTNREV
mgnify:CR=1 FL=1